MLASLNNLRVYIYIYIYIYIHTHIYRICSRNLRTFFSILAAEKLGCVKYADILCGGLDLGFILV